MPSNSLGVGGSPKQQQRRSPQSIDEHVGRRLRMRRIMQGMSQAELAGTVGLTFQQIQKYEGGKNRISARHLYQFSRALECSPMEFYEGFEEHSNGNGTSAYPTDLAIRLSMALTQIDDKSRRAVLAFVRSLSEPTSREGGSSKGVERGANRK